MDGRSLGSTQSHKNLLKSITKGRLFTEEALSTALCEVESIVNSRPLTPTSDDPSDYEALTPQHPQRPHWGEKMEKLFFLVFLFGREIIHFAFPSVFLAFFVLHVVLVFVHVCHSVHS